MDDTRSEHPDEGTIHAWLDGALDEPTASGIAAHVATCGECAERVAEARGLIAGASRVVRALDDDSTASAGPTWGQATATVPASPPTASRSTWRALRVTPLRAAIAATVLVALGLTFTSTRTAVETDATRMTSMSTAVESAPAAGTLSTATQGVAARDAVLDSAIARNVAEAQPPRTVGAASTTAIPVPTPSRAGASEMADPAAATRVAAGRSAVREQRDSGAGIAADQLASRNTARSSRAVMGGMAAASARGDSAARVAGATNASTRQDVAVPASAATAASATEAFPAPRRRVMPEPRECYQVERASAGAAAWGPVNLPFVVAVNADGRSARVLMVDGGATDATTTVTRGGNDSLFLRLTRPGYEGTLEVGAVGAVRAGVMRSAPVRSDIELSAASGASMRGEQVNRRAPGRQSAPQAGAAGTPTKQNEAITMPATSIVARRIMCPV